MLGAYLCQIISFDEETFKFHKKNIPELKLIFGFGFILVFEAGF
jgi:hypothetical protein